MSKLSVKILGMGAFLPSRKTTTSELEKILGYPKGALEKASGVHTRYLVHQETASEMGANAAKEALSQAGIDASEIDAVISVSAVPQQAIPTNSVLIHKHLKLKSTVATFDVNSTCLSFLTGFLVAANLISGGIYRKVLLVSSEIASCGLNPNDPKTASLFGDGAAACILSTGTTEGILAHHFETFSEYSEDCKCESGGTLLGLNSDFPKERGYFTMKGTVLFKAATKPVVKMVETLKTKIDREFDLFIPHQASPLALDLFQRKLRLKDAQFMNIVRDYGNMISASIPFTLYKAIEAKRLKRGDIALLFGTGAGLTVGGLLIEY